MNFRTIFVHFVHRSFLAVHQTTCPGGGTPYNGLYRVALPERGAFFALQVYVRVGFSGVEVYERVGKSAI